MNWFYRTTGQAEGGPVDEATLKAMHRSGEISGDTELRREDSETWIPFAATFSAETPPPLPELQRCAECDQPFPPDQLITLAGRQICATCKPMAIQKYQEGVVTFGASADPESLWQDIKNRGFDFTISSVLHRAYSLLKLHYWPAVGVCLLGFFIILAARMVPCLGALAVIFVIPQMMAGLGWYFLRKMRGEPSTVNDSFAGFRRGYWQQALFMLIVTLILAVFFIPMFVMMMTSIASASAANDPDAIQNSMSFYTSGAFYLFYIPMLLAAWYLGLRWGFTSLLILEKGLKATQAMKLSARVAHMHFWKLAGLMFISGLIALGGALVLCVGLIFVLPFPIAAWTRLYEDAFGDPQPTNAD